MAEAQAPKKISATVGAIIGGAAGSVTGRVLNGPSLKEALLQKMAEAQAPIKKGVGAAIGTGIVAGGTGNVVSRILPLLKEALIQKMAEAQAPKKISATVGAISGGAAGSVTGRVLNGPSLNQKLAEAQAYTDQNEFLPKMIASHIVGKMFDALSDEQAKEQAFIIPPKKDFIKLSQLIDAFPDDSATNPQEKAAKIQEAVTDSLARAISAAYNGQANEQILKTVDSLKAADVFPILIDNSMAALQSAATSRERMADKQGFGKLINPFLNAALRIGLGEAFGPKQMTARSQGLTGANLQDFKELCKKMASQMMA